MTDKKPTILLVVVEKVMNGSEPSVKMAAITEDQITTVSPRILTDTMIFSSKAIRACSAGDIYRFECKEDRTTIYPSTREYVGPWGTTEWRAGQQAEMRAWDAHQREVKRLAKLKAEDPLDVILQPLIDIYANATPSTRPQLLARIVYKLTIGKAHYR